MGIHSLVYCNRQSQYFELKLVGTTETYTYFNVQNWTLFIKKNMSFAMIQGILFLFFLFAQNQFCANVVILLVAGCCFFMAYYFKPTLENVLQKATPLIAN